MLINKGCVVSLQKGQTWGCNEILRHIQTHYKFIIIIGQTFWSVRYLIINLKGWPLTPLQSRPVHIQQTKAVHLMFDTTTTLTLLKSLNITTKHKPW